MKKYLLGLGALILKSPLASLIGLIIKPLIAGVAAVIVFMGTLDTRKIAEDVTVGAGKKTVEDLATFGLKAAAVPRSSPSPIVIPMTGATCPAGSTPSGFDAAKDSHIDCVFGKNQ